MVTKTRLQAGLNKMIKSAGTPIKITYFTATPGSVYDDDIVLSQNGSAVWTSGVVLPIDATRGSFDSVLVEQGKLIEDDQRLFVVGSLNMTGSEQVVRIGLGSPIRDEFSIIPPGAIRAEVSSTAIYKKVYIRRIGGTGPLQGEN